MTEEQFSVVQANPLNNHVVLAAAGSGKTRTMVIRAAYLLSSEPILSNELLILTYNADAKKEFESRFKHQAKKYNLGMPIINTFHAFSLRILKDINNGELKTVSPIPEFRLEANKFKLENLARSALKHAIDYDRTCKKVVTNDLIDDFIGFISLVKSDIKNVKEKFIEENYSSSDSFLIAAYREFEKRRIGLKIRFFDDLVLDVATLLMSDIELKKSISTKYKHIIVDEYQDVNPSQQVILETLTSGGAKIMVVGDPDQCIYEWRGAKPEFITHKFKDIYPDAETHTLSYTFRNGHGISLAANSLIRNNQDRVKGMTISYPSAPNTDIFLHSGSSADSVVEEIKGWINRGNTYDGIAILSRLYAMATPVEFALITNNIPYKIDGDGKSIFEQPIFVGFKALLEFHKGVLKSDDEDIFNKISSILMLSTLRMKKESRYSLVKQVSAKPENFIRILKSFKEASFGYVMHELDMRIKLLEHLSKNSNLTCTEIFEKAIALLEMHDQIKGNIVDSYIAANKALLINGVLSIANKLDEISGEHIAEIQKMDMARKKNNKNKNSVLITTIHKAKGAEWPMVILPSLEEGLFPYYKESSPPFIVDSERRLFYVAITRAQKELHIMHPSSEEFEAKSLSGDTSINSIKRGGPSRFVYEANFVKANEVSDAIYKTSSQKIFSKDVSAILPYIKSIQVHVNLEGEIKEFLASSSKPIGFFIGQLVMVEGLNSQGTIVSIDLDGNGEQDVVHVDIDGRIWPLSSKKIGLKSA